MGWSRAMNEDSRWGYFYARNSGAGTTWAPVSGTRGTARHCSRMSCSTSRWESVPPSHVLRSYDFENFRTRFTNVLIGSGVA